MTSTLMCFADIEIKYIAYIQQEQQFDVASCDDINLC